jgi:hypothetical protein
MRRQQEDAGTGDERKGYEIADEERGGEGEVFPSSLS